jgi:hypothetical protein
MVVIMLISQEHYEIASSRARNLLASKHAPGLILRPSDSVRWHVVDHQHSSVVFFAGILGAVHDAAIIEF